MMLFLIIAVILLCLLLMFIRVNRKAPRWARNYDSRTYKPISVHNPEEFVRQIENYTIRLLEKEYVTDSRIHYSKSLLNYLSNRKLSVYQYGEYGYLLYYLYLYAENTGRADIKKLCRAYFDKGFIGANKFEIVRTDQASYGNIALKLYEQTQDKKYLCFADEIYALLQRCVNDDGFMIYRKSSKYQHVDALALCVPFLVNYSKERGSQDAYLIAEKMVFDYMRYGVDHETGIPCQAYNIENKAKILRSNWSRGIAWYLLGVSALDTIPLEGKAIIDRLEKRLVEYPFYDIPQYIYQDVGVCDMSATIPITFYLYKKSKIDLKKNEIINIYSPYIRHDGCIAYMSPTISMPNEPPTVYGTGGTIFQGMLLYMLSIMK